MQKWSEKVQQDIGARLRLARQAKGFSLRGLAERMQMSHGALGHWETGKNEIPLSSLWELCTRLGVSADKLLFDVERWPFERVDYDKVNDLDPQDRSRLEGGLLLTAVEAGIDVRKDAAADVDAPRPVSRTARPLLERAEAALSSATRPAESQRTDAETPGGASGSRGPKTPA